MDHYLVKRKQEALITDLPGQQQFTLLDIKRGRARMFAYQHMISRILSVMGFPVYLEMMEARSFTSGLPEGFGLVSTMIRRCCQALLLLIAGIVIFGSVGHAGRRGKTVERYATREGNVIQLHPSEAVFQVPSSWREGARFLLTSREVSRTRKVLGTEIADGALYWRDCAVQVAPDNLRWLRVYVVDGYEEEILKRIQKKGLAATSKIPNYMPYDGHVTNWGASLYEFRRVPTREGPWEHVDIPYSQDFGDYYGDGYVSFYLRPVDGRELVIAVGYSTSGTGPTDERQNILRSVALSNSPAPMDSQ